MKSRIAAAVAVGYLLGRTRKMKLAIVVGGLLAGKKLPTDPTELLKQGLSSVSGSEALTGDLRARLVDAAKTAAGAAASRRIDSWGDALTERAAGLRGEGAADLEDEAPAEPAEAGRRPRGEDPARSRPGPRSRGARPAGRPSPRRSGDRSTRGEDDG